MKVSLLVLSRCSLGLCWDPPGSQVGPQRGHFEALLATIAGFFLLPFLIQSLSRFFACCLLKFLIYVNTFFVLFWASCVASPKPRTSKDLPCKMLDFIGSKVPVCSTFRFILGFIVGVQFFISFWLVLGVLFGCEIGSKTAL